MDIKHLIDFNDMPLSDWEHLLRTAQNIIQDKSVYTEACKGKVFATLFFEPSTRTQFSFQAAIQRLGGTCLGFSDIRNTSVQKGENFKDTIRTMANYVDAIIIRHPKDGAAKAASLVSRVPVINAGDGGHLHPTQTLTDLLTISQEKGGVSGHKIGFCGDLKYGRTVHSLIKALTRFDQTEFYLISTEELTIPEYIKKLLQNQNMPVHYVKTLDECIGELDILYMTRIQKERFATEEEYQQQKGVYVLTPRKMDRAKRDMIVMHPLPKIDEIVPDVDDDPRAIYFKQAEYGMYVRMALLYELTKDDPHYKTHRLDKGDETPCRNPNCISNTELYLPKIYRPGVDGERRCQYCDKRKRSFR